MTSISIFDLDHTLIDCNSSFRFGAYLYRRKFFGFTKMLYLVGVYASYKAGIISIQKLHTEVFKMLFKGRLITDLLPLAEDFLNKHLQSMLYIPVYNRLRKAQQHSQRVIILSSSPDFIVSAFATRLGIYEWSATTYHLDPLGKFSFVSSFMLGKDKARYVENLIEEHTISANQIVAFSDSQDDVPFLKAAGNSVVVNPNRYMLNLARDSGWEIL